MCANVTEHEYLQTATWVDDCWLCAMISNKVTIFVIKVCVKEF